MLGLKFPRLNVWLFARNSALLVFSLVGMYKGIISSAQFERLYEVERIKSEHYLKQRDSISEKLWAKDVLAKSLIKENIECNDDFDRLDFEFWYKKLVIDKEGEWRFEMVFVNKKYERTILGARLSREQYISNTDYAAHPSVNARQYWKADSLVVAHWKKIYFKEPIKMSDGSNRTGEVPKWPERRGGEIFVFGAVTKYHD